MHCANCCIDEKICRVRDGVGPSWCPTLINGDGLAKALEEYEKSDVGDFARGASVQEAECYAGRENRPFVLQPVKSRAEELIEFAKRMGYRKLGLAFCGGLIREASVLAGILECNGFEVAAVICKVGGVPKEKIRLKDAQKIRIGEFEPMCNPIAQAELLNRAGTDFNVMLGLCIGHDSLFLKYIEKLTTVFAVKDRVTGHNPMAVLYTSGSYYQKLRKARSTEES